MTKQSEALHHSVWQIWGWTFGEDFKMSNVIFVNLHCTTVSPVISNCASPSASHLSSLSNRGAIPDKSKCMSKLWWNLHGMLQNAEMKKCKNFFLLSKTSWSDVIQIFSMIRGIMWRSMEAGYDERREWERINYRKLWKNNIYYHFILISVTDKDNWVVVWRQMMTQTLL